jgi:hypothetical protein
LETHTARFDDIRNILKMWIHLTLREMSYLPNPTGNVWSKYKTAALLCITFILVAMASISCSMKQSDERAVGQNFPTREYASNLEKKMIEASFRGDIDTVKSCLTAGARVNSRYGGDPRVFQDKDGGWPVAGSNWTAVMAATEGDQFGTVEFLISMGANINLEDGWGATPLYVLADKRASRPQYDRLAALFIESGANVNAKTIAYIDGPSGQSVLHRAVLWGHVELVRMLVAAGADAGAKTSKGETPLDYVIEGPNVTAISGILKEGQRHSAIQSE